MEALQPTNIYRKRFLVAGVLVFLGICFSFSSNLLGVINATLSAYLGLTPQIVDWFSLSSSIGVLVGCAPVGLYASFRPLGVKTYAVCALLLNGAAFFIIFGVVFFRGYAYMMIVAQVLAGITSAIFMSLIGLANTMWFPESEQGKLTGIVWSSLGLGNVIGAASAAVILHSLETEEIEVKAKALSLIFAVTAIISVALLITVGLCLPKIPPLPPSLVEAERRKRYSSNEATGWRIAMQMFFVEVKTLLSSRTAIFLLAAFSVHTAVIVMEYLLMPPVDITSNSSVVADGTRISHDGSRKKAFEMIWFALGITFGGLASGFALDHAKTYRPQVAVVSPAAFLFGLITLVSFVMSSNVMMDIFLLLFGFSLSAGQTFTVEILKQYSYPKVSVVTQGITLAFGGNAITIISTLVTRTIMNACGNLAFYVTSSLFSATFAILLLSINPTLNRHVAEKRALTGNSY